MLRAITAALCISLLMQGCDRLAVGVRNDTQEPLAVQLLFRPGAECKTYDPIVLAPGKGTATRCLAHDIEVVKIRQRQKECDISGAELVTYYGAHAPGSAYPIRTC